MRQYVLAITFLLTSYFSVFAQSWTTKLDKDVRFYQPTDLGVIIVGTEKSLYAVDSSNGDVLWRRKDVTLDETDVAPVPGTDLLLLSFEKDDKSRIEAVDIFAGDTIWRSEKIKGAVMQLAVEPSSNLLAVVLVKDARDKPREGFKRRPLIHLLELTSGDEFWKSELSEVEMMPTRWYEDRDKEVDYTFDNYYPPVFVDGRLYLFYEGVTSFEARTGKERLRERYSVNEGGFALTEAEPIFDRDLIYTSGRGHLRAISRQTGKEVWEAKDLGLTPEMILVGDVIYVRTGGILTRLKEGEASERGPYGVSAVDARTGKVLWRYKGADKGITNLLLPNSTTLALADRDDLILIDAKTGKRLRHTPHNIERASFGVLNENGQLVIGGQSEIVAFDPESGRQIWRARHTPPGRGILRTIGAIAARAASLYFRYGGTATTAFRGLQIARAVTSVSWSGLATRSSLTNLQTLVTTSSRNYGTLRLRTLGISSMVKNTPGVPAPIINSKIVRQRTSNVEERLLDRLDPAHQLDRLSRYLWHRERLAALRGQWMYFYTSLSRGGSGLGGVNINTGRTEREIKLGDLDERFVTDEALGIMFMAAGGKILAYPLQSR